MYPITIALVPKNLINYIIDYSITDNKETCKKCKKVTISIVRRKVTASPQLLLVTLHSSMNIMTHSTQYSFVISLNCIQLLQLLEISITITSRLANN